VARAAGTTYYIAADFPSPGADFISLATGLTVDPRITYDAGVSGDIGGTPTTDFEGGAANPGCFGPNFDIAAAAAVPEPSTAMVAAFGAVAFLACG
jgi:hypothetical protein